MTDDDKPRQTFDRRGPEEIEPGRKGGSGESQGCSVTKDAAHSDSKDPVRDAERGPDDPDEAAADGLT